MCVNQKLYAPQSTPANRSSPRQRPSGAICLYYECTNASGLVSNSYQQLGIILEGVLGRPPRYVLLTLLALVLVFGLGIAVYLAHIRASATVLINSAREIRTTADAEREIAAWKARSGSDFWKESDHPGGDHNYDAQIVNLAIARLRLVQPTVVTVGITMRGGQLRCVTVIEITGWQPVAAVEINEWFDSGMPSRIHLTQGHRPLAATVDFPSSLPEDQRTRAFAVDTSCFVRRGGCKDAQDILPGIWQLGAPLSPN
jgi:hypothetical protein